MTVIVVSWLVEERPVRRDVLTRLDDERIGRVRDGEVLGARRSTNEAAARSAGHDHVKHGRARLAAPYAGGEAPRDRGARAAAAVPGCRPRDGVAPAADEHLDRERVS